MELDRAARPLVERDLGRTYRYLIRWLDSPVLIDRTKRTVVRTTGDPDRFDVAAALRPGARA